MGDISLIMILVEGSAFVSKNECCSPEATGRSRQDELLNEPYFDLRLIESLVSLSLLCDRMEVFEKQVQFLKVMSS